MTTTTASARLQQLEHPQLQEHQVWYNDQQHLLIVDSVVIDCTPSEYDVLLLLLQAAGEPVPMKRLTEWRWPGKVFVVRLSGAKNPNDLYQQDRTGFRVAFQQALEQAEPVCLHQAQPASVTSTPASQPAPAIFSLRDLLAWELPPVRWAVPEILPEGLTLLAGKPKLGKSWLALSLALSIASGGVALGKQPVAQGEVLYLALEENARRLQARARQLLASMSEVPAGLDFALDWPRLAEGGLSHTDYGDYDDVDDEATADGAVDRFPGAPSGKQEEQHLLAQRGTFISMERQEEERQRESATGSHRSSHQCHQSNHRNHGNHSHQDETLAVQGKKQERIMVVIRVVRASQLLRIAARIIPASGWCALTR